MVISKFIDYPVGSGGMACSGNMFLLSANNIYVHGESDTDGMLDPDSITGPGIDIKNGNVVMFTDAYIRPTVNSSGIMFLDEYSAPSTEAVGLPVDHRAVSGQIIPLVQNSGSGLFLGNSDHVFSKGHISGIYLKPIEQKIPTDSIAPKTGDIWNVINSESYGENKILYDTGSGIVNLSYGSGIFYTVFNSLFGSGLTPVRTWLTIPWINDIMWDSHFMHDDQDDAVNTHVYVRQPGWYEINYSVGIDKFPIPLSGSTSYTYRCMINNTDVVPGSYIGEEGQWGGITNHRTTSWNGLVYLNGGDSISVQVKYEMSVHYGNSIVGSGTSLLIRYVRPSIY